jgi:hypothetical protein
MTMANTPSPHETLLLWRLLANGGGDFLTNLKQFDAKERKRLKDACLLDDDMRKEEPPKKGARAKTYLSLSERGWDWAQSHLDAEISGNPDPTKSLLRTMLTRLKNFLERHHVALADFISSTQANAVSEFAPSSATEVRGIEIVSPPPAPEQMRAAYFRLSGNKTGVRVRLADLRRALAHESRERVDSELMELEKAGEIIIYPLDDPKEITDDDRAAALNNSAGSPRHIVYIER